ncbi:MAG: HDOD domain-containing protein [Pseudomonadota bacterium]
MAVVQPDLRKKVFRIERLGALPQVVWSLVEALGDERTSASRLEQLLGGDLALASKVLSLANSSYYGMRQRITTISRAIVIIGFEELRLLALGAGLADLFHLKNTPKGFESPAFWVHSLAVSWAARELAVQAGYPAPEEIRIAGLLHDVGKLILATHFCEDYLEMISRAEERPYYLIEQEYGLQHTELGRMLAHRWGLPEIHIAAIANHHDPLEPGDHVFSTALVHLADRLIKALGLGLVQKARPSDIEAVLGAVKMDQRQLRSLALRAQGELPVLLEKWMIFLGGGGIDN